jgi:HD-like signal output (HDOD) protein
VTQAHSQEAAHASLAEQIRQLGEDGEITLPPLPEIATRLAELLQDEESAETRQVAELIEKDPAIASAILRMANSASFAGMKPVTDVNASVARLGMRQVSLLVTAIAHKGHFTTSDPRKVDLLHALWDHAVATAIAARHLAAAGGDDRSEAFLAGLLHDTGKLLVLKGIDHLEKKKRQPAMTMPVVEELMSMLHARLGHVVLTAWNIPVPACRAALHHHDAEPHDLLVLRVQAANAIARKLGAHPHPDPDLVLVDVPAVERLNLGDLELATLIVDVEDEFQQVRALL